MDEGDVNDCSKLPDGVKSCYQLCVSVLVIYGMPVLFWLVSLCCILVSHFSTKGFGPLPYGLFLCHASTTASKAHQH